MKWQRGTVGLATLSGSKSVEADVTEHMAVHRQGAGFALTERATGLRIYVLQTKRDAKQLAEDLAPYYHEGERIASLGDMRPSIEPYRSGRYVAPKVDTAPEDVQVTIVEQSSREEMTTTKAPVDFKSVRRWLDMWARKESDGAWRLSLASLPVEVIVRLDPCHEYLSVIGALEAMAFALGMTRDEAIAAVNAEVIAHD